MRCLHKPCGILQLSWSEFNVFPIIYVLLAATSSNYFYSWWFNQIGLRILFYFRTVPISGAGTGVPFHWHGPGFGEVVYGRKVSYRVSQQYGILQENIYLNFTFIQSKFCSLLTLKTFSRKFNTHGSYNIWVCVSGPSSSERFCILLGHQAQYISWYYYRYSSILAN